jgi:hypothetical protein
VTKNVTCGCCMLMCHPFLEFFIFRHG